MATPEERGTATFEGYDRELLYSRLHEVVRLAGELRYVDKVLEFIAAEDQIGGIGPGPRTSEFEVRDIGWTYPFSRGITKQPMPLGYEDTVSSFLEGASQEAETWRETNLETLLRTIEPVTHPDTSYYEEIVENLRSSYVTLTADPDEGNPPSGTYPVRRPEVGILDPDAWNGTAARSFRENFYLPFRDEVRGYQAAYTKSVMAGFVRAKAIDELAQISLLDAVTAAREALLEQLRHRQRDTGDTSTATVLVIVAAGTSILAVISAPAAPVSASLGAISGALYYAAGAESAQEAREADDTIKGQSADDLYFGLFDVVSTIAYRRREHYDTLDVDMGALLEWADGRHTENVLIPRRPTIAERDDEGGLNPDLDEFTNEND